MTQRGMDDSPWGGPESKTVPSLAREDRRSRLSTEVQPDAGLRVHHGSRDFFVSLDRQRSYTFGRSPRADIVIKDDRVSRFHGTLEYENGSWHYEDLGSSNGSFLFEREDYAQFSSNEQELPAHRLARRTSVPLRSGEGVLLGSHNVRFELLDEIPTEASRASAPVVRFGGGSSEDSLLETKDAGFLEGFRFPDSE